MGENIDEPSEPQSSNDCDVEDQFDEDDQDHDDDISNDCPYQFNFSSPEIMVSVPVIKFMSDPSINRNVTEYLRNNHDRPQDEIEYDINQIIRDTLSSLPEEGTELDLTHEGGLIDHHKKTLKLSILSLSLLKIICKCFGIIWKLEV